MPSEILYEIYTAEPGMPGSLLLMSAGSPESPFRSMARQVADAILEALMKGAWEGQLPGENRLAEEFKVSRPTVRRSLELLTREGVLQPAVAGKGRKLSAKWHHSTPRKGSRVGILTSCSLGMLMPGTQNCYREIRKNLERKGCDVSFHTSAAWHVEHPGRLLRKVIDQHPAKAWIVKDPTPAMEQWLEEEQIPCLCIGGTYQHTLPRIGSEGDDTIRNATRELIEWGHREIFYPVHDHYGVQMTVPFLEEMRSLGSAYDDPCHTPHWTGDAVECFAMLERLFNRKSKPTAFVTLGLVNLLPILTWLGGNGFVVPHDVSIIHILGDPILDDLYPPITHYRSNEQKLVKQAARLVLQLIETGQAFDRKCMLPMQRIEGRSIAQAPGH